MSRAELPAIAGPYAHAPHLAALVYPDHGKAKRYDDDIEEDHCVLLVIRPTQSCASGRAILLSPSHASIFDDVDPDGV